MYINEDIELIEFVDLLTFTFSPAFREKWRYRYSTRFIELFQVRLLESLNKRKTIKLDTLFRYLTTKCKYSSDQVQDFFITIDIDLYRPLITGKLSA